MRILDAFTGEGGFGAAFIERGHDVVTTDIGPQFGCTITGDIRDRAVWDEIIAKGPYDGVLAGPPCEGFSMAAVRFQFTCTATCADCGKPLLRAGGERWIHEPTSINALAGATASDAVHARDTASHDRSVSVRQRCQEADRPLGRVPRRMGAAATV